MQQYEKMNGNYSQEDMLEFDEEKLTIAKINKHKESEEINSAEVNRLIEDIKERSDLLLTRILWNIDY